jgi:hypothetical protein
MHIRLIAAVLVVLLAIAGTFVAGATSSQSVAFFPTSPAQFGQGLLAAWTLIQAIAGPLAIGTLIFIASAVIYFLPAIVGRNRRNAMPIFLLNLFLGWTLLGWVVALVWAAMPDQSSTNTTSSPTPIP